MTPKTQLILNICHYLAFKFFPCLSSVPKKEHSKQMLPMKHTIPMANRAIEKHGEEAKPMALEAIYPIPNIIPSRDKTLSAFMRFHLSLPHTQQPTYLFLLMFSAPS
jgi:hypothetical protein